MLIYLYYALAIVAVIIGVAIFAIIRDFRAGSTAPRSSCSSSRDGPNSFGYSWLGCRSCGGGIHRRRHNCGGGCGGGDCGGCGGGGGE
ncbi:MAG: hypothetical protein VX435_13040 [Planctomycetota bacterium]|nr:hypothetical protein [Planctomycetota bacterium]